MLLKELREYPYSTITKMFRLAKRNYQYYRFLHKIQQTKMKELWDNEKDEAWEYA